MRFIQGRPFIFIIFITLLLSACAEIPSSIPQPSTPQTDTQTLPVSRDIEQANQFLASGQRREAASAYFAASDKYNSPHRERLILQAAELASILKDSNLTERYLAPLNPANLNRENLARYRFVQAQLAHNDRNYREALRLLPQRVNALPSGLASKILNARLSAAQASGDKLALIQELVLQEPTLKTAYKIKLNHERIWGQIQQMPLQQINAGRRSIAHPTVRGWLDLAYIEKVDSGNNPALQAHILEWKKNNPRHPGAEITNKILAAASAPVATTTPYPEEPEQHPPSPSAHITSEVYIEPKTGSANSIAVMLPLSGKLASVGNTLLQGIKQAYHASNKQKPLKIYDSGSTNISQLYQKALSEGAAVVIGPFDKSRLAELARSNLPRPTLGLNYLPGTKTSAGNLYQFGLLPEDEAVQIAQFAMDRGQKRVAILTPDSKWGERLNQAIRNAVSERGGSVVINKRFLNSSTNFSYISKVISTQKDRIDAILLAATPRQAQHLYPALREDIKDLPVYATSHVFSGKPGPGNAHLEGLIFTETPWVLKTAHDNSTPTTAYPRLYALGMDAFMVASHLDQLQKNGSPLNGRTGRIRLSRDGTLHRELMWAKFVHGKPIVYAR